ncbi:MAG: DsbA family protein [Bdellovibrionia bacterium]
MNKIFILALGSLVVLGACTKKNENQDNSQKLIQPLQSEMTILEYTGGQIKAKDIEERMTPHLEKARETLFNSYLQEAEKLLIEQHQDRLNVEVNVTDEEIKKYILANKILPSDAPKIRDFLVNEKLRLQKLQAVDELKKSLNVKNKIGSALFEVKGTSKSPSQGETSAKVKIQVFCDFANGMCSRVRMVLAQAEKLFGKNIYWVYRHFPVASNPGSFESAKIGICAFEQGKFWPVYDALSNLSGQLQGKNLNEIAVGAGLSKEELEECLSKKTTSEALDVDIKSAQDIGIAETPTLIINGQKVKNIDQVVPTIESLIK